jgi:3,4-dihydroxy 2-butanone 4-phosphate synthase/GTP cyclohydrolase II
MAECPFPTDFGDFRLIAYQELTGRKSVHLALVMGKIEPHTPVLVRVHLESTLCDVLLSSAECCGWPLRDAMRRIGEEGKGVIVLLRAQDESVNLIKQIERIEFKPDHEVSDRDGGPPDRRVLGIGAQILTDLSVSKMNLLSAPQRFHGLGGFGLEVVEYIGE